MKIAIVGLGLSGSGVLRELLNRLPQEDFDQETIDIYERKDHLGNGYPYAQDATEILMNSSPGDLSINPDDPDEFVDWIKENYPEIAESHDFIPRPIYGDYLNKKVQPLLTDSRVKVINQKVHNVLPIKVDGQAAYQQNHKPYHYQLVLENGELTEAYDGVFLCIGHPPYADHYQLMGAENYIHNPYPVREKLSQLDKSKKVALIGSGLSSLDVMRYLQLHDDHEWDHAISFYIRNLPFTIVRKPVFDRSSGFSLSKEWIDEEKQDNNGLLPLDHLLAKIKGDFQASGIDWRQLIAKYGEGSVEQIRYELNHEDAMLEALQGYIDRMKPLLSEINMSLSASDWQRMQSDYLSDFEHFRNQLAQPAMEDILAWQSQGKLTIESGLKDIKATGNAFEMVMADRIDTVDIVINTAGFEKNVGKAAQQDPLIQNLWQQKLITPGKNGQFIQVTWPESQIFNQNQGVHDNLYLLGFWIFGTQFGNNNASMSIKSGEKVARHFIDHYYKNK